MTTLRHRRLLGFEALEPRRLLAAWQNPVNPLDVDASGSVNALDVLTVVSDIVDHGSRRVPVGDNGVKPSSYLDVNGDGWVSPIDALIIVSALRHNQSPLTVVAHLAPDSDPNANGVVLKDSVTILGQTLPGAVVRIAMAEEPMGDWVATSNEGRFSWELPLRHGMNRWRVEARNPLGDVVVIERTTRRADMILDWNAALLNVVRDWTTRSDDPYPNRIVHSAPPVVARNLALIHVAMFDAMEAIEPTHIPYHAKIIAPEGASPMAAAASAAYHVASHLYPHAQEQAVWAATLAETLGVIPDGPAKTSGIQLGYQVASAILAERADDGSQAAVTYEPSLEPGMWRRTFPNWLPPLVPHWGQVTPLAIPDPELFRPPPPPALESAEYADAVDEVMRLGGFHHSERDAEQTEIALFWADGPGTFTPPGHWNQIASDVSLSHGLSPKENARLLALLNIALADAAIASWDAKYAYHFWRPIDAIQNANQDGNPATIGDPQWIPLLVTPPFPAYTSGHSTFSGAAEIVLSHLFGNEVSFASQSDGHQGLTQRPLATNEIFIRTFTSFTEAAEEASKSRIYGGIHFSFDNSTGLEAGRAIGRHVMETMLLGREDD